MSTGSLAVLISQQPYTFPGLTIIGTIVYLLNIVLFITFSSLLAVRFLLRPRALWQSLHHPSECFFFGAFWVSLALILNGMTGYGIPGLGDDKGWLVAAMRVLFWMYYACAIIVAVFEYHVIFQANTLDVDSAVPAWILPAYPFLVSGPLAAQVSQTQPFESSIQIIIAGVSGQGLGWTLALLIYTVYLTRLIRSEMPSPSSRPGMYVSVGPAAYTCAGLISLGQQAQKQLPDGYLGVTSLDVGDVWLAIAVPAGLFLWMVAIWFSSLSTLSVLRGVRQMRFSLQWWAFVFPNAGLAIATIQVGQVLQSPPIKAVGSALTVILVCLWIVCAVFHVRAVWNHDLLCPGKDPDVDIVNSKQEGSGRTKTLREEA